MVRAATKKQEQAQNLSGAGARTADALEAWACGPSLIERPYEARMIHRVRAVHLHRRPSTELTQTNFLAASAIWRALPEFFPAGRDCSQREGQS